MPSDARMELKSIMEFGRQSNITGQVPEFLCSKAQLPPECQVVGLVLCALHSRSQSAVVGTTTIAQPVVRHLALGTWHSVGRHEVLQASAGRLAEVL